MPLRLPLLVPVVNLIMTSLFPELSYIQSNYVDGILPSVLLYSMEILSK